MNKDRDRAVQLLFHYFGKLLNRAGLQSDSDTVAEIEECVDSIIAAAVEETKGQVLADLRSNNQLPKP